MARIAEWTRQLKAGQPLAPPPEADAEPLRLAGHRGHRPGPHAGARAAGRRRGGAPARCRASSLWTEERLKQFVEIRFGERPIFVVSNREPVSHVREGRRDRRGSSRPAAWSPRSSRSCWPAAACGWRTAAAAPTARSASASGLPTRDPAYTLRRVWLTEQEEAGYYYGFANEGLWPLCHIVHERPQFRADDWEQYRAVNAALRRRGPRGDGEGRARRSSWCRTTTSRCCRSSSSSARPDARVALFWHIPWPNPEAFRICPWQKEILDGLLGADLSASTSSSTATTSWTRWSARSRAGSTGSDFTVVRGQHTTWVRPFPISVAPETFETARRPTWRRLRAELGVTAEWLGIGVDRVDYTKGLPERFRRSGASSSAGRSTGERMVFVQIAAPSRTPDPALPGAAAGGRETVRTHQRGAGRAGLAADRLSSSATTTTPRSAATTGRPTSAW